MGTARGDSRDSNDGFNNSFIYKNGQITRLKSFLDDATSTTARDVYAEYLSRNGRFVVGTSRDGGVQGVQQAFIYDVERNDGVIQRLSNNTPLGSYVYAVTPDGKVAVGNRVIKENLNASDEEPVLFRDGQAVSLGPIKLADNVRNAGYSATELGSASLISDDGRIIAGQYEISRTNYSENYPPERVFIYQNGSAEDIGTLRADNLGLGEVSAMTPDGKYIVGAVQHDGAELSGTINSEDFNFDGRHAFLYNTDNKKMADLGTLLPDNQGNSEAKEISDDGRVVFGISDSEKNAENNERRAVLWKIKYDINNDPIINTPIDVLNTQHAMFETARKGFRVLDLYQSALSVLANARCQQGVNNYCVGAFGQFDFLSNNRRLATGLFGSMNIVSNWRIGAAVNFADNTKLTDNYDNRHRHKPGIGLFTRYQKNNDGTGISADISASIIRQRLVISREAFANTESGKGNSKIKGYQIGATANYGIKVSNSTLLTPNLGIVYHQVSRKGYTESGGADFIANFQKLGIRRTDLQIGLNIDQNINEVLSVDGRLGSRIKLGETRDDFKGEIESIGVTTYKSHKTDALNPYFSVGLNIYPLANSVFRTSIGWEKTDYRRDALQVGVNYAYRW